MLVQTLTRQASAAICSCSYLGKLRFTVLRNISPILRQRVLQSPNAKRLYYSLVLSTPQRVDHCPTTCNLTELPRRPCATFLIALHETYGATFLPFVSRKSGRQQWTKGISKKAAEIGGTKETCLQIQIGHPNSSTIFSVFRHQIVESM